MSESVQISRYRAMGRWYALPLWVALAGIGGCGGGGAAPVVETGDREMFASASAGQLAFLRGSYEQAIEQYHRAVNRARLQDDPALIGDQAYSLGIALIAGNKLDDAHAVLTESEAALRRAGAPLADVLLVEARLAYRQGPGADAAAARVLNDPLSQPTNSHRAQVAILRTEIACDQSDIATAGAHLAKAQPLAASLPEPTIAAGLARVTARVNLLRGDAAAAAQSFDLEAQHQRQARRYTDLSKALLHAAEAYRKAGQSAPSADRFYRAALSLAAQEKRAAALVALDAADTAASQAGDANLHRLIESLRVEVHKLPVPEPDASPATLPAATRPSTIRSSSDVTR